MLEIGRNAEHARERVSPMPSARAVIAERSELIVVRPAAGHVIENEAVLETWPTVLDLVDNFMDEPMARLRHAFVLQVGTRDAVTPNLEADVDLFHAPS